MKSFANVSISANASDSFFSWITKTNEMRNAFQYTVTVSSNAIGESTTGNGFVIGVFGANTLTATTIRGGNVGSSGNVAFGSNVDFSTTLTQNNISSVSSFGYTTSNTATQMVDSFANTFIGGKYIISVTALNGDVQMTELMLMQKGANALMTEYAQLYSNIILGVFTSNTDTGSARLYFTPTNANNTLKFNRTLITV